jgi:hypothetical protein
MLRVETLLELGNVLTEDGAGKDLPKPVQRIRKYEASRNSR